VSPLVRVRAGAIAALSACAVATAALPASAGAAIQTLRVGPAPRLPAGAHALDSLPQTTRLQLAIGLRPRDPGALATYASAVSTPGSADEHRYMTPAEFRQVFGPTAVEIASVDAALRARGLDPEPASADGLLIPIDADAGAIARALGVRFERYRLASGRVAYANTAAPRFTTSIGSLISGVAGLDDVDLPHAVGLALGSGAERAARLQPHVVTGGPQPCNAASTDAPSRDAYTADQLASAYNFSSLYEAGDLGSGETVALLELSDNPPSDIGGYQTCYDTSATVNDIEVDGGAASSTTTSGEEEATLDIEDVIGLAPRASVDVYQAPNGGAGVLDDYAAIIDNPSVNVVSTSWGECETNAGSAVTAAEATLFEQAATEGKSVFAATGDSGSSDCYTGGLPHPAVAVDDPASQPYVTGVGGLTLSSTTYPPSESVWNGPSGAGGGGVSEMHSMPTYQSGAPTALGMINSDSSGTPCGASSGSYCREVPDVSADGDPATGYLIYFEGGWTGVGGTSAAAPLWAAFAALMNAWSACHGTAIGFANPGLYAAAGSSYASDFTDVTAGDNDYSPSGYSGGLYPAGTGYDMASGLGSPNGATLPAALCGTSNDKVTLVNPGSQSSTIEQPVSLQLNATDLDDDSVSFAANGLPTGLSISAGGMITGTPTTPTFAAPATVSVTVTATSGATAQTSFTWNIVEPPPATPPPPPPAPATTQTSPTQAPTTSTPTTPTPSTGPAPTPTPTPTASCSDGQLLANPGFESGARDWSASGHVIVDRRQAKGSETPRAGSWFAWLGGHASQHTATLSQTVTMPSPCTTATLTFWRHVDSTRRRSAGVADTLTVQLVSSAGTVLKTLATYSNRNTARGYRRASFSVAVAPGSAVSVRFTATLRKRGTGTTDFCLDDTAFAVS
jgi:hypothetical protein